MNLFSAVVSAFLCVYTQAFSAPANFHRRHDIKSSSRAVSTIASMSADTSGDDNPCQVLLMDHFNINHEKGRHDALKAFYFDFLGCAIDPRKEENLHIGKMTLWANAGMHQFHLPEGKPNAQVFDGVITLIHEDLSALMQRYNDYLDGDERFEPLKDTEFLVGVLDDDMLMITDPWGNEFSIMASDDPVEDRASDIGAQPLIDGHTPSEVLKWEDLTVYLPHGANLDGIGRFYEYVLGAQTIEELGSDSSICIGMGERQTLSFQYHPDGPDTEVRHHEFSYDDQDESSSLPFYPSNHGPHISLYVTDVGKAYQRAEKLGVQYVNPRFKRRAYTEEEALDQCMFRLIDIVDPLDENKEVIIHLEHEVRSAKTRDGKKYKSCPLNEV